MPRELVLGNGSMLVNFDRELNMRDLYYPKVGLSNHILGHRNRIGIWAGGRFSWTGDSHWRRSIGYRRNSLVSEVEAESQDLGVLLKINDAVHFRKSIYIKRVEIFNKGNEREIRMFFTHDLSINENGVADTAIYEPNMKCICHYKRDRYFLINGSIANEGIFQYAIGTKRFEGAEGTWRDAEDGHLEENPVAHGSIDSTVSFRCHLGPEESATLYYWIVAGTDIQEVREGNRFVLEQGPERLFTEIAAYWDAWIRKKDRTFHDLSEEAVGMFHRSLLVIRTQTDNGGAILASTDSDVLLSFPDHYNYMWPRDGALVAYALDLAGYPEVTARFYEFCQKTITEGGYFLHKYNADGTLGSSWHPWWKDGSMQLPIQEDETALVLFSLGLHYDLYRDIDFIESLYPTLVTKAADFLVSYRDPTTRLPMPSFDLWEERRGIFSFTCGAVYGALTAAASLAYILNDSASGDRYGLAAMEVREATEKYLYSPELGRFIRGVYPQKDGSFLSDTTLDSSLYGVFEFGAFSPSDPRVKGTMEAIEKNLWVKTQIGGAARYVDDYYARVSHDIQNVPGNPWIICTLWLAEWYAETAESLAELARSREIIEWAVRYALPSGVFSEQIHPYSGEPLSVAPLTWSHSTYVLAVEKYVRKYSALTGHLH